MEVLTKDGLTYYHNKIKNTFVKQSDLDTAIDNKLDTIDWVTEIGDAYVTPEQVSDIISQSDLDNYLPKSGGTMTGAITYSGTQPVQINIVKDANSNYRDIQVTDGTNRIGVIRFNQPSGGTYNEITLGASDANNDTPSGFSVTRQLSNGAITCKAAGKVVATFDSNNKLVFPDGTTVWIELPT